MRISTTIPLLGFTALIPAAVSQDSKPPEKLDLSSFPGEIVEKVVVPVPAEVFAVLDKMDEPNWNKEIQLPSDDELQGKDRIKLSLKFGSLVGEGFIAVQAKDVEKIKKIGEVALKLGNSLGLGEAVEPHSLAIVDAAEKGDWQTVRVELDRTQATVADVMEKMRDEDLGTLVSLGGWIRGTDALTSLISDNFTTDKSELLNQPELVRHFTGAINEMGADTKLHPDVTTILKSLGKISIQLKASDESGEISADRVAAIGEICHQLLEIYYLDQGGDEGA